MSEDGRLSLRLLSETTGKTVVSRLQIADGFWLRLVGWQFRAMPAADAGLLLVPCNSLHTCFVRFPIDVVFLDEQGAVLAIRRNLRPWRAAWGPPGATLCLRSSRARSICSPGKSCVSNLLVDISCGKGGIFVP